MFNECNQCCAPDDGCEGCGDAACRGCGICDSSVARCEGIFEDEISSVTHQREDYTEEIRKHSQETITERADRTRTVSLSERVDRDYVKCVSYQPVDTITKTVEVPVVRTIEKRVPKVEYREKVIEVPKYETIYKEKIVEHQEVHYVDKIVEVPKVVYKNKYVDKVEMVEKVVEREVDDVKYVQKYVDVPTKREVFRYEEPERVQEYTHRVPNVPLQNMVRESDFRANQQSQQGHAYSVNSQRQSNPQMVHSHMTEQRRYEPVHAHLTETVREQHYDQEPNAAPTYVQPSEVYTSAQMSSQMPESVNVQISDTTFNSAAGNAQPQIEQVFRPQVVQNVEIQKHIPISVDVPVAYMVPKPVVVPVQVPVLKFKDNFVPVPVRRRVIPRIKWTNEIFEVECIKEMPYLQIQDVVKPVPCDVEIKVHEYVDKAVPINPTELSQGDIHAMWMRVNADLAEKKKEEMGDEYPYVNHPDGTVFGEPGISQEGEQGGPPPTGDAAIDPLALHPGHPLSMTYLQNEWMKTSTMETHKMYSPEWFEAHQRSLHGMETGNPTQVLMSPEQAEELRPQDGGAFGSTPWMGHDDQQSQQENQQDQENQEQ